MTVTAILSPSYSTSQEKTNSALPQKPSQAASVTTCPTELRKHSLAISSCFDADRAGSQWSKFPRPGQRVGLRAQIKWKINSEFCVAECVSVCGVCVSVRACERACLLAFVRTCLCVTPTVCVCACVRVRVCVCECARA